MWNSLQQQHLRINQQQQLAPPIHQHPPHHHLNNSSSTATQHIKNTHNNNNNNSNKKETNNLSLHSYASSPALRSKDLGSWCEAFDKHELVDILVKISGTNSQFQSYLGHAFVTDIKWCKIRVTFSINNNNHNHHAIKLQKEAPTSLQIQQHFNQYGAMKKIECFPQYNSALITFENYTYAQSAVSVGVHENICNTIYNASCCYEFEGGNELLPNGGNNNNNNNNNNGQNQQYLLSNNQSNDLSSSCGPLEQRRIFVSSLSYSTTDETLENVFSQYGELEDCTIVKDKLTQRSKGYGFVVFKNVYGAINALKQSEKFIDGRRTRSWLAAQGNQFRNNNR